MTYYELLGVSPNATTEEIKSAYNAKLVNVSFDNQNELKRAYELLSDTTSRDLYDEYLVNLSMLRDEISYDHFVEKMEDNQLNDGTLISKWTKLYRLDWREWKSLSKENRLSKIYAEMIFRCLYGLVGIICVFFFLLYASHARILVILFSADTYWIRMVLYGIFLGFFFGSKGYGHIYRQWKLEQRSD
jgi:hypothetical protein